MAARLMAHGQSDCVCVWRADCVLEGGQSGRKCVCVCVCVWAGGGRWVKLIVSPVTVNMWEPGSPCMNPMSQHKETSFCSLEPD